MWSCPTTYTSSCFAGDRAGQVRPNDRAGQVRPLRDVVGAFKAQASRRAGRTLWQRGYHDRIIRTESELNALREYIATNPLRWTLRRDDPGVGAGPVRPGRQRS